MKCYTYAILELPTVIAITLLICFFKYYAKNLLKSYLIKADGIHADSDGIPGEHLLGRHLVGHRTQVHT